ncbi:hypothetical protein TRAPUB_1568, partial [Trametes pubescens]
MPRLHHCEVVPTANELPCPQLADGKLPYICEAHREEYRQLTTAYRETSRKAEDLYSCASHCKPETLCTLAEVEAAANMAELCIETIGTEIRKREAHHWRFFNE